MVNKVVSVARSWIGTPYHHQGNVKQVGTDCLGLIRGIWEELYGYSPETPPPYTKTWGEYGKEELMLEAALRWLKLVDIAPQGQFLINTGLENLEPGAVLFFRRSRGLISKHCAILASKETIIHSYSGVGVVETDFKTWSKLISGIFRYPDY